MLENRNFYQVIKELLSKTSSLLYITTFMFLKYQINSSNEGKKCLDTQKNNEK